MRFTIKLAALCLLFASGALLSQQPVPTTAAAWCDFARPGDSLASYALRGLTGHLDPPEPGARRNCTWNYVSLTGSFAGS